MPRYAQSLEVLVRFARLLFLFGTLVHLGCGGSESPETDLAVGLDVPVAEDTASPRYAVVKPEAPTTVSLY